MKPRSRTSSSRRGTKPARARATRKPARAAATRAAKRPAARRKPAAAKRAAPRLTVVRPKPVRRPAPAPAFPQREGASPKQLLLFELLRARAAVLAALQGLTSGAAEARTAEGRWSIREIVLHLHAWDIEVERVLEAALHGAEPEWLRYREARLRRLNAELLAPLSRLPWEEACRRLHLGRDRLLEELESLPEEPAEPWTKPHALFRVLAILPHHDRHHAQVIKALRGGVGASPRGNPPQPRST